MTRLRFQWSGSAGRLNRLPDVCNSWPCPIERASQIQRDMRLKVDVRDQPTTNVTLKTQRVRTLEPVWACLDGRESVDLAEAGREGAHARVRATLVRLNRHRLSKPEQGLVKRCMGKVTGLFRAQLTRPIGPHGATGRVADRRARAPAAIDRSVSRGTLRRASNPPPPGQGRVPGCARQAHPGTRVSRYCGLHPQGRHRPIEPGPHRPAAGLPGCACPAARHPQRAHRCRDHGAGRSHSRFAVPAIARPGRIALPRCRPIRWIGAGARVRSGGCHEAPLANRVRGLAQNRANASLRQPRTR